MPQQSFLFFFTVCWLLSACKTTKPIATVENCNAEIIQGIEGNILFREGNWMPGPDMNPEQKGSGVQRDVYIYELTKMSQTTPNEERVFFSDIKTKFIKKITSSPDGCFKVSLPVGRYSLFVVEEGKLYANRFDGEMHIFPVLVEEGNLTHVQFIIDHKATY
jgi:hypothetical protein